VEGGGVAPPAGNREGTNMKILVCDNQKEDAEKIRDDIAQYYPETKFKIITDWVDINDEVSKFKPDIVLIDLYWQKKSASTKQVRDVNRRIEAVHENIKQIKAIHVHETIENQGICALELLRQKHPGTPVLMATRFGNFMLDASLKKRAYIESSGFLYKWDDPRTQMAKIKYAIELPHSKGKNVFIGHGRSSTWKELKDFIDGRLELPWIEFNRESAAGVATSHRLEKMLSDAAFAFLVMTAEEEHADATRHPRSNVVHEAGLFQGRLGFRRAIILLEDGCSEFSNIVGLGQIRFQSANLSAKFEEIRQVLEREGLLAKTS
jgi:predicted nucleotide-binding protein